MSTLNNAKKEEYKRILKKEIENVTEEQLNELVEYLFHLACIELSILQMKND